ncbi:MAG: pilus assembly protein [Gammaproteobacteria bacterium]|nr:pilus assembly protein [Gammaproteobacteria bacterium]
MTAWPSVMAAAGVASCAALASWMILRAIAVAVSGHHERLAQLNREKFEELFLFVDTPTFLRWNAAVTLVVAAAAALSFGPLGVLVAGALAAVAPSALHRWLRRRRLRALERQLPDVADSIAGSLRSGSGLGQAIARVAAHQPAPAAQEFSLVLREHRLGVPLEEALASFATRSDLRDLHMLVAVLGIARDLGGGLAGALDRLAASMRRRLAMEDRIRALTSQGRLQGMVMGALPLALGAVLTVLEPEQMSRLYSEPLGWLTLGGIALLELGGFLLLRKIVRIEV